MHVATAQHYFSTCSYCGVGCGVAVTVDARGQLGLAGNAGSPVNRGALCAKGRYLHHVVADQSDRLLYPQMRAARGGALERTTWDAALGRAARTFRSLIQQHGPDSVGFYVSGQLLTEDYYVANKLVKGFIGCNNIDTNSRLCMSSAVAAYKLALGDDLVPGCYEDFDHCRCFLIAGANPAWCHPVLFQRIEARKRSCPETKVIVVDPRKTSSTAVADLHLQLRPGADVYLYNAIARILIERNLIDEGFLREHVSGVEALREELLRTSLAQAAETCQVPLGDIEKAAEWIGRSGAFMSLWAMGLNQSVSGVDKNLALLNLSLLTGQIGKPGAGPFSLTGQPNAMGGREVGGMATMLAAHRDLADPAQREHVARFWGGGKIAEAPGLTATEMIEALESGRLKALWIICTNPAVSWPNLGRAERALQNAAFVVVQDISTHADTLAFADLVLPAAGWLEKEGTMTNSERRVSHLPKAIEPPGEALADWQILCRFAWAMGWGEAFSYANASEIFDEHCRLTRGTRIDMSGMNYRRLKREGALQWPCPGEQHPGMARLFTGHDFATPDGRARLTAVRPRPHAAPVNDAFPFVLLTGRTRDQWHTMTRTGKVSRLLQHEAAPYLEVHPRDAERLELGEGDVAIVENERGQVRAQVRITDSIKEGAVFLPMHWGKAFNGALARANNLTSGLVDPISKEPDFKYAAVRVGPVQSRKQQILVVGAGAAAHQFIRSYRESGGVGRLVVFGREALPFYNRILLPEYIAGAKAWRELVTLDASQLGSLGVEYVAGAEVVKIERDFKRVVLANGSRQPYDKLVLAVGSSASVPKEVPRNLPGIFVLRERGDADRIRASLQRNEPVVIVGGGPLGVELADALAHSGAQVTLIHRSTSLMGGVLDATAARLVKEILEERGVEVYLKDAILRYEGGDAVEAVHTRSGLRLPCRAVCIAAGTAPNNALPRQAGLDVAQGVLVNRHMQTSDPDIYAIGEIAEFNGTRHGTTAAAQEQATAAANHLKGHTWNNYRGSVPFNVLKIRDADVCSIGLVNPAGNDCDEITLLDARMRYYKKCVVRGARLVGAILVGDKTEFGEFRRLIEEQTELEDLRATLLRKTSATRRSTPRGKLVCSCFNVGEGDLKEAIDAGCDELESVCARSLAGTGCGSCRPDVQALLDRHCALQCLAMAK